MAGVNMNTRTPADEFRAIELERQPARTVAESLAEIFAACRRLEMRKTIARLDWEARLSAALELVDSVDDVIDLLEHFADEAVDLNRKEAR